jgi:chromosome segregation ATPase
MMQSSEIQQRFSKIEQTIHQAAQACEQATGVPMDVKDSIQQLEHKSQLARTVMAQADEDSVRQCIDDLEQLGDRARDACQQAGKVDEQLNTAVMQVHSELSDLKHQLH